MAKSKLKNEKQITNALEVLTVEYVPVNSVYPNSYNPNRQSDHEFQMLIMSILVSGVTQSIIVDRNTNQIVDGEHRWTGMIVAHYLKKNNLVKKEDDGGYTFNTEDIMYARAHRLEVIDPSLNIPVTFVDMNEAQRRLATLQHNKARGSHDIELEAQVMRDLQMLGATNLMLDTLGMTEDELNRMIEDIPAPEALASEEYGQAWEPTRDQQDEAMQTGSTKQQVIQAETHGGVAVTAMTADAIEKQRDLQQKIAVAKNDEEKKMAQQGTKLYRLSLMYSGEQGEIVAQVLGEDTAENLLKLCKEELQRRNG